MKDSVPGIYIIKNITDNKIYIGKGKNIHERFLDHKRKLRCNKHWNIHLQRAWSKDGEECFEFNVLEELECDNNILNEREIYWIKKLNSTDKTIGYNLENGGLDERIFSQETRDKMSKSKMGHFVSPESREKCRKSSLGRIVSEETKEKLRNSSKHLTPMKGLKHSDETKEKIRQSKLGDKNPNYKKSPSQETREKLRITNTGKKLSEDARKKISESKLGKKRTKNKVKRSKSTSIFWGVSYLKLRKIWEAWEFIEKKHIRIGLFLCEIDAAVARDQYIINNKIDKPLNFPVIKDEK